MKERVRSDERHNKLKPVWDFILVKNLTSVFSQLFTCVHMNWGQMKLKTVWISYRSFWSKWIFKRHEIFMWTGFTRNEMNRRRLVGCCVYCACTFETQGGYGFHIGHFDRNKISFRVIEYHVNATRNEMPTHVHQIIGSFWNVAEMKLHVNRTCFHPGLKPQLGMTSFRLSCERNQRNCVTIWRQKSRDTRLGDTHLF